MIKKEDKEKKRKWLFTRGILALLAVSALMVAVASFTDANIMQIYGRDGRTQFFINDTLNETYVGVGTSLPLATLDVNGSILSNGSLVCTVANNLCSAGSGAPASAQYITLALDGTLTNERVITPGAGIVLEDFGANNNLRINVSATKCVSNEASKWNGTAFVCINSTGGGGSGDIEGVLVTNGIIGGGTSGNVTLEINETYTQRRVNGTCSPGSSIRAVDVNGSVTCETDSTGSNNFPVSISVTGTTTKNISIERSGLANISATFTDDSASDSGIYTNISILQAADASFNSSIQGLAANITALNTTTVNRFGLLTINVTNLQSSNTTIFARVDSVNATVGLLYTNVTVLQIASSTANTTYQQLAANISSVNASLTTLTTFAQTKAATGTATCAAGTVAQNVTLSNTTVSSQCVSTTAGSGFTYSNYFNQSLNTSDNVSFNKVDLFLNETGLLYYNTITPIDINLNTYYENSSTNQTTTIVEKARFTLSDYYDDGTIYTGNLDCKISGTQTGSTRPECIFETNSDQKTIGYDNAMNFDIGAKLYYNAGTNDLFTYKLSSTAGSTSNYFVINPGYTDYLFNDGDTNNFVSSDREDFSTYSETWTNGSNDKNYLYNITGLNNSNASYSFYVPVNFSSTVYSTGLCLNGDCRTAWPTSSADPTIYTNISILQAADASFNTSIQGLAANISALNTTTVNRFGLLTTNVTNLQTSNTTIFARVDSVNTTVGLLYTNVTVLQTASAAANTTYQQLAANISSVNSTITTINNGQYTNITVLQTASSAANTTYQQLAANISDVNRTRGNISGGAGAAAFNIAFFNNFSGINGTTNGIYNPVSAFWTLNNLSISTLTAASCDLKANTTGGIYCGIDSSGSGTFVYSDFFNQFLNRTSDVTFNSLNITDNLNVTDNLTVQWALKLGTTSFINGTMFSNSTCTLTYSPGGASRIELCD